MATTIAELLIDIGVKSDDAVKAEKRLKKMGDQAETGSKRSSKAIKALEGGIKKFAKSASTAFAAVGAASVAAGAAIFKLVDSMAQAGDQAAKDAKKIGITAEAVQELGFAAELSGADFGTVKTGLQAFARGLDDAITKGTGPAKEAFERLGISMDNPILKSRDLEQILPLLADEFKGLPNDAEKTAIAMKLFSKSGAELIPLLNEGADGIASMRQEARDLGIVISDEGAASSEVFVDTLLRLKSTVVGVRNEIAVSLTPTILDLVKRTQAWVEQNKDLVRTKVEKFIKTLIPIIKTLAKTIAFLVENFDKLLGLFIGTKIAQGFAAVASGFQAMGFAAAGALGPIGLIAGALIALIPIAVEAGEAIGDALGDKTSGGVTTGRRGAPRAGSRRTAKASQEVRLQQRKLDDAITAGASRAEISNIRAELSSAKVRRRDAVASDTRRRKIEAAAQAKEDAAAAELDRNARAGATEADRIIAEFETKRAVKQVKGRGKGRGRRAPSAGPGPIGAPVSGVTVDNAIAALLGGDQDVLTENLRGLATATPSTKKITPTVAIDFFSFEITQNITSPSPKAAGDEAAAAIRNEFRKATAQAGQGLATALVR